MQTSDAGPGVKVGGFVGGLVVVVVGVSVEVAGGGPRRSSSVPSTSVYTILNAG